MYVLINKLNNLTMYLVFRLQIQSIAVSIKTVMVTAPSIIGKSNIIPGYSVVLVPDSSSTIALGRVVRTEVDTVMIVK